MKATAKVLPGKLLVKQADPETVLESGIIIPETSQEKKRQGEVVAVGDDTTRVEMAVRVGDTVFFVEHAGHPVELKEEDGFSLTGEFLLLDQNQVLIYR